MARRVFCKLIPVFAASLAFTGIACRADVSIKLGQAGLTTLRSSGTLLLSQGTPSVQKVTLTGKDGRSVDGSAAPTKTALDTARQTLTHTYPWGEVSCTYAAAGSRLNLTIEVRNTSPLTLSALWLQVMALRFPQPPRGWVPNVPCLGANIGDPTVDFADYGVGTLALCNDDVVRPLLAGFPGRADLQVRPIWVCSSNIGYLSPWLDPYLKRPIAPGGTDTYRLSLRFGASGTGPLDLAGDLYRKLAVAFPPTLHWPDRRPVGTLHLAASEPRFHSATNPRGWFMDPAVDVTTAAGTALFRRRLLAYADTSVAVLKKMNAQGMITWDLEGEQYPQATTYIGDPRLLPVLDPEMDASADAYYQKFRAAGFRTGLCIRPQRLVLSNKEARQQELTSSAEIVQLLYDKMAYAYKRWGCTLFYVDSNGDPNVPYDPAIFQNLTRKLAGAGINALVMPEHKNLRYFAYTAPYAELRLGVTGTSALARTAYPSAHLSIYAPDGPLAEDHEALVKSVRRGDLLLFRAWWDDPQNAEIRSVFQEAAGQTPSQR